MYVLYAGNRVMFYLLLDGSSFLECFGPLFIVYTNALLCFGDCSSVLLPPSLPQLVCPT